MLQRFLDPSTLASISGLDLVAKTVVDGFVAGLHRSPDFGFSQEFAEYRAYSQGDDLRHVDWNVFARTEKTFLKRYRGETNTQLLVLLDTSASMAYGSGAVTKLDCGFKMDLLVEDAVVLELKTVDQLLPVHSAQLLTYLKLSGKKVGLLINFNEPVLTKGLKRLVNHFREPSVAPFTSAPSAFSDFVLSFLTLRLCVSAVKSFLSLPVT